MKNYKADTERVGGGYTHLIWDFNGTILDDVQLGMDCVNLMLARRGLPVLSDREAYRRVFGFPIEEYYRRLGFNFEKEDYHTVLAPEWVKLYLAGEGDCCLHEGVTETLTAIRQRGMGQVLLSASNLGQLKCQLAHLGLSDDFEEILGLDNIHAHSKSGIAIEWRKRHPTAVPLFVGDTVHDADVADMIGADCVLFSGGHQSHERLIGRGKTVLSHISELIRILDESAE